MEYDNEILRKRFDAWVEDGLAERGWSLRELGRRSGFSHSHISNVQHGVKNVTWDVCAAIAAAFGETPEQAFRRVGLLPSVNGITEQIASLLHYLSPDELKTTLKYIEWQRSQQD